MKVKGYFKDTNVNGTLAKKLIYRPKNYIKNRLPTKILRQY